ncbi:MAG: hypothetical protein DMG13_29175 [Acidobacteria bacterium]|nr:MAG: hypothetical protein DMG13_29175 [Acidobacteriota bacterium]
MTNLMNRRDLLKLTGMGVAVFVSGTAARAGSFRQKQNESFYFVQLSDTHWGFNGPNINPDSQGTLKKAVAAVNALDEQPDFVVFTGDLTQTTEDRKIRRDRMAEFRDIVSQLKVNALAALVLVSSAKLGVLPVQADVAPSRLEARVLGSALHAAVARHASNGGNPIPASEENLIAGAGLYRQMYSRCSKESNNDYGRSFYPPAPTYRLRVRHSG